jgi:hypothetical protein
MKFFVVGYVTVCVLVALVAIVAAGNATRRCHERGAVWSLATEWSPIDGCSATVLGTRVRV